MANFWENDPPAAAPKFWDGDAQASIPKPPLNLLGGITRAFTKGASFGGSETERAYARMGVPPAFNSDTFSPEEWSAAAEAMKNITPERLAAEKSAGAKEITDFNSEHPVVGFGSEMAGSVANPIGLLMGGGAAQLGQSAMQEFPKLASGLGKYMTYGGQGALSGAGQGILSDPEHPLRGAGTGAVIGGALGMTIPALAEGGAKGWSAISNKFKGTPTLANPEQAADTARAAYKESARAGVVISPDKFKTFVKDLPTSLEGFRPRIAPKAAAVIEEFKADAAAGKPVTLELVDELRKIARSAADSSDRNEVRLGRSIIDHLDKFVDDLTPGDIAAGDGEVGIAALTKARQAWTTHAKLRNVSDIVEIGENLNDPNWVKNQFRAIVRKPKIFNQYSEAEQDIIKGVARTGNTERIAKMIPWRGLQMAAPYMTQLAQSSKLADLQRLILSGGGLPPAPGISPDIARLLAGSGAPVAPPVMRRTGSSNQIP